MLGKVIRHTLNRIPRPALQRFAHVAARAAAPFLAGEGTECPICSGRFRRLLPYGYSRIRANALCPRCLSLERHRMLWCYLRKTDLLAQGMTLLHIAPERCLIPLLREAVGQGYMTADLESPLADIRMDLCDIPLEDGSVDAVICNHVLEHVADDSVALSEIRRILRPGGWAVLMSPVRYGLKETREAPEGSSAAERYRLFGQSDHMREYGNDYPERLRRAGFKVSSVRASDFLSEDLMRLYATGNDCVYLAVRES